MEIKMEIKVGKKYTLKDKEKFFSETECFGISSFDIPTIIHEEYFTFSLFEYCNYSDGLMCERSKAAFISFYCENMTYKNEYLSSILGKSAWSANCNFEDYLKEYIDFQEETFEV